MQLSVGIVGLPNVGKSTLFNILTQIQVPAENFPFCTIDPNVGIVAVADPRLEQLNNLVNPAKLTPAVIEFWDIAGLVKGASTGAGLGNKFLANIRAVSVIVHVVRAFENSNVTHVEETVDPARDISLINTELILKDLETVSQKILQYRSKAKTDKVAAQALQLFVDLEEHLNQGLTAGDFPGLPTADSPIYNDYRDLFLLTSKPVIFVVNADSASISEKTKLVKNIVGDKHIVVGMDIQLESEIAALPPADQIEFLAEIGYSEPAINRLTRECYQALGLISFFTAGEQEVRAWTIREKTKAPQAAGEIHTDFEKKFITAEIVKFDDFMEAKGWLGSKEQGKVKLGGKDYVMQDGDVVMFRHNA